MMCRVLGVSASGYHAWHRRPPSRRGVENQALGTRIAEIHEESGGTYGGRRVHATLRAEGRAVSRQRVERLMRSLGLQGVHRRRPRSTTRADPHAEPVPDRVKRQFEATEPNRLWVADSTYVDTQEGFLFLAIVIDVFSRKVVGWAMAARQTADLTRTALEMALETRGAKGVIFHSDHGSQYTAVACTSRCAQAGVLQSMGAVGSCYDNAMAESFFATLECELLRRTPFETRAEATTEIFKFVAGFYTRRRRHSALGCLSPNEFEDAWAATRRTRS